jgi:predicted nucleotidyltransferase component of viral defense system
MIGIEQLLNFYPPQVNASPALRKYILKEYIQLTILEYLTTTHWIRKLTLTGGTNLRLAKGIDRFSEDLDFDCKNLTREEFMQMTDDVLRYIKLSGWKVEIRDKPAPKLTAYRRNFHFPVLLFDLGLSGFREERFLIKIEAEDQKISYNPVMGRISGCGMFFLFPVPSDPVLCAMKLSALITRQKGRDFYDCIFLLGQTQPDFDFLQARHGIGKMDELKVMLAGLVQHIDLEIKSRDFQHLLYNSLNSRRILAFGEFVESLI